MPWDPVLPVTTAWDLGIGDSTAIWFCQQLGAEVRLIDYLECSGVGLDYYAKALQERPYVYGEHLLPHDVQVNEMGTGKSRLEVLAALGIRARVLPQLKVDDGIQAVRALVAALLVRWREMRAGTGGAAQLPARLRHPSRLFPAGARA